MGKFSIVTVAEEQWNQIVSSYQAYDIYYVSNYAKAFQIHGDGEPLLLSYESESLRGIKVVMKRDISLIPAFLGKIEPNTYFDIITPYGYGGFLFEGNAGEREMADFKKEYALFCCQYSIISDFSRYHPLLENAQENKKIFEVINLGHTISMDLVSKEIIWSNMNSTNRNKVRKAQKSGVLIKHGKGSELFDQFRGMYNATMDKDRASAYYYFEKPFYDFIHDHLQDHYELFYAEHEGKIIAMSLMLFANRKMHYHLSGSSFEYRHLAPSNLLLYEAACWGNEQGFETFHLGSGVGAQEDNLFNFKKSFNRNSGHQFSIGKEITNKEVYERLVKMRTENESSFDNENSFFPCYRG